MPIEIVEPRRLYRQVADQLRSLMASAVVCDGRNLFSPAFVKAQGFEYHAIGRRDTSA